MSPGHDLLEPLWRMLQSVLTTAKCTKLIVSCSDKGYKSHSNSPDGGGRQLLLTPLMTFPSYLQKNTAIFHLLST